MSEEIGDIGTDGTGFNRRSVLKATGVAIGAGALVTGTASASIGCANCVRLGKLDRAPRAGETLEFELDGTTVRISIDSVRTEDGDVKCFSFSGGQGRICRVDVKGGPDTRERYFCEGTTAADPCAPPNPNSGKLYGISNVVFYWCDETAPEGTGYDDCACEEGVSSCSVIEEKDVGGGPPDDKGGGPPDDEGGPP